MNTRSIWLAVFSTASLLCIFGCQNTTATADDEDSPKKLPPVEFKGQVEPKLAGNWMTADQKSGLNLEKDGTATILHVQSTPGGNIKANLKGFWLTDSGNLKLKYQSEGQSDSFLEYAYTLTGDKLELTQKGGRAKTVYSRKV